MGIGYKALSDHAAENRLQEPSTHINLSLGILRMAGLKVPLTRPPPWSLRYRVSCCSEPQCWLPRTIPYLWTLLLKRV